MGWTAAVPSTATSRTSPERRCGKPTQRQTAVWNLEKQPQGAAFAAATIGAPCEAVDAAARYVITDAGFGREYSVEPMIAIYGEFGIRLEDCLYMTEAGPKWFTEPSPAIDKPFA